MKYKKNFLRKFLLIPTFKIDSVSRISLDFELHKQFKRLKPGVVLEVGVGYSSYKKYIPYTRYFTLDFDKGSNPDICCDVHHIKWTSEYFDTVIAIEVLEHVHTPEKVIDEIWRILKPGGVCILSTRFIYPYHPGPKDYYRFTWDSLELLFKEFKHVEIYHHGNRIQSLWQIINYGRCIGAVLNLLNPFIARLSSKKTNFPLGFVLYARK